MPLVGRKTDASASPKSLDKRRPELSFPGSMVALDHPDLQPGRHCPPLKTFALPSDVVESKTLAKALALASWFQARP